MKYCFTGILVLLIACHTSAQSDETKMEDARYALEKAYDCNFAKIVLGEISDTGKKTAKYIYYMAKTYDCAHEYDSAIYYYRWYLDSIPKSPDVKRRIAKLAHNKKTEDAHEATLEKKKKQ